jgi:hypothetical protein
MSNLTRKRIMKRLWIGFTALGSIGLLTTIVLTISEGVKYRIREEQGLDPIWAPTWVAVMSNVGLCVFVLALLALAVLGGVALRQHQQQNTRSPDPIPGS